MRTRSNSLSRSGINLVSIELPQADAASKDSLSSLLRDSWYKILAGLLRQRQWLTLQHAEENAQHSCEASI